MVQCHSLVPPLASSLKLLGRWLLASNLKPWGRWSLASLRDPGPPTKNPGERFPWLEGGLRGPRSMHVILNYSWLLPKAACFHIARFCIQPLSAHPQWEPQKQTLFLRDLEEFSQGQEYCFLPQPWAFKSEMSILSFRDSCFHPIPHSSHILPYYGIWNILKIFLSHFCCSAVELIMQNCVLMSLWYLHPGGLELCLLNITLIPLI